MLFSITNILNTMYTMKQQDMGQQQMPGMKLMMYIMPVMFIFIFNGYSSGFELLLLHFRTDWYPHYGDSAQNN